ncbi:MAG: PAS domain S-box protein [Acidobacteria bacterium]|jgi:PAS domain S-box-containing protein|nr:PAS domain S-box protein [Acidobacteriota bacterium]
MSKKYCIYVFIVIILIFSLQEFSATFKDQTNDFKFEHISIAQGLSQSTVYCVLQDSKGFMWFGTQHGLNRYDGNTFKLYDYNPKNSNGLSYNLVLSIYEDKSGMIWVGTWGGGLNKFDPYTGEFTVYKKGPGQGDLSDDNINAIFEDHSGTLWIGTDNGLNKCIPNQKNGIFRAFLKENNSNNASDKTQSNRILSIYQDKKNNLWVGAEKGLYKSNRDKTDFILCPVEFKKINAIVEYGDGILWLGTENGLYKIDRENYSDISFPNDRLSKELENKYIQVIYKNKSGIFWIGTSKDGLYRFDPMLNAFNRYRSDPINSGSLSHNDIRAICEDRTGLMWIGTFSGGADKFDPRRKKFKHYGNAPDNSNSYESNEIWAIVENQEGVFIGTRYAGIYRFDPVSKKFSDQLIPGGKYKDKDNSQKNSIRSMCAEKKSNVLWVGTDKAGLYRFNIETKEFSFFEKIDPNADILSIYEDRNGILWIGTMDDGLTRIDKDRKNIKNYNKDTGKKRHSLSDNKVFSIYEDKQGILWIGTGDGGLNRFDKEKEIFRSYIPTPNDPNSISYNFVAAIYEDSKGVLWIGTGGGGLNKLINREKGIFKAYGTVDGLPDNVIYAILEDRDNNLWLSTNKGLSRFDPRTEKFKNYTVRDGLQDYEFNRSVACKLDKDLYFGGVKGFNVFDPMDFETDSPAPDIVITSFKKFNQGIREEIPIPKDGSLHLSYNDYSISFEFEALDFADPANNRYAYKLEPGNEQWINLGNKHELTFPSLEPGEYTLRVKGANNEGTWNEEGASVKIIVSPPFTSTWFFKVSLSLFIIGFIFGFIQWRIYDVKKKGKAIKEAYVALRESEERYRSLVETSPDAIALCDIKGRLIMTNQQTAVLLGYANLDEMKTHIRTIFNGITAKDRARARKNAENVINTGIASTMEFTLRAKDGNEIAAEISTSLIKDSEGQPRFFLAITRDITERKEANKKLMQAEKMASLGKLVSGVAHEINNPISIIVGKAEAFSTVWNNLTPFLDRYEPDDKGFSIAGLSYREIKSNLDDSLKGLMENSNRIKNTIKELSDFSRPEDPLNREAVQINKVIDSSLHLLHNMIKKVETFSFEQGNDIPIIWGNYQRLERVFINLIRNACQALPDNSHGIFITTSYDHETKQIIARVKDEGIGICKENLKQIAEPFFTTKRTTGGTGLGVSISQQIIQEHNGKIEFDSQVGKGTTVSIYLPVIQPQK